MITIPLKGKDRFTAISRMKIAEAIAQQPAREIAVYVSHCTDDSNTSLVVMARRIPYHVDAWKVSGPVKERISRVNALTTEIQTAYANLKAANHQN